MIVAYIGIIAIIVGAIGYWYATRGNSEFPKTRKKDKTLTPTYEFTEVSATITWGDGSTDDFKWDWKKDRDDGIHIGTWDTDSFSVNRDGFRKNRPEVKTCGYDFDEIIGYENYRSIDVRYRHDYVAFAEVGVTVTQKKKYENSRWKTVHRDWDERPDEIDVEILEKHEFEAIHG